MWKVNEGSFNDLSLEGLSLFLTGQANAYSLCVVEKPFARQILLGRVEIPKVASVSGLSARPWVAQDPRPAGWQ